MTRTGARLPITVGLILLFGLATVAPTVDSDYFWHLRLGRWIVENRWTLPNTETFSHTAAGTPVLIQGWLFDVVQYLTERTFGRTGIRWLVALVFVATWAAVHASVRISLQQEPRAMLVTGTCMMAAIGFLSPRPLLASNLGFALVLLALLKFRATGNRRWLAPIPPAFALWGNLHFGFLAGLALIGVFTASALFSRIAPLAGRVAEPGTLRVSWAALLVVLSLGALCLNPHGMQLLTESFAMTRLNAGSGLLEWTSPDFQGLRGKLFLLPLGLLAVCWALGPRRPDWLDLLLALPLAGAALVSQRHIPLACIAIAPIAARALAPSADGTTRPPAPKSSGTAPGLFGATPGQVIAMVLAAAISTFATPIAAERDRRIIEEAYPAAAVSFVRSNRLKGPLLNSYLTGGFLVDRLADQVPVFIDGRYTPFAGQVVRDHDAMVTLRPGWDRLLERYGIRLAILGPEDAALAAAMANSGGYRLVHADRGFKVLIVNDGTHPELATLREASDIQRGH